MTEVCKDCGKPGFADAGGAMQHDRRAVLGAAPDGKERRVVLPSAPAAPAAREKPPRREHILNRKVF